MDYKITNELCFQLHLYDKKFNEDSFTEKLIDFAVNNKVSISGNLDLGFCFCAEEEIPKVIKNKFIYFLCRNYSDYIEFIHFEVYNEKENQFKKVEEIKIESPRCAKSPDFEPRSR